MPKRIYPMSELEKYRLEQGDPILKYARKVGLSRASVYKVERGQFVNRAFVARYLRGLGIDLRNQASFPPGLQIIDEGATLQVQLTPQS